MKVCNVLDSDGSWDWNGISFQLPRSLLDKLESTPRSLTGTIPDQWIWSYSTDGNYSRKSAYMLARGWDP